MDHFSEGDSLPRWRVTRRKHRAESWYYSHKSVTPKAPDETSFIRAGLTEAQQASGVQGFKLRADARTLSGAKGGCNTHYKYV